MKNWKTSSLGWITIFITALSAIQSILKGNIPDHITLMQWWAAISAGWIGIHAADASVVAKVQQKVEDNTTQIIKSQLEKP